MRIIFVLIILLSVGCSSNEEATSVDGIPAELVGAHQYLSQYLGTTMDSCKLLSAAAIPTADDIKAVFVKDARPYVQQYIDSTITGSFNIIPRSNHTDLLIYKATSEDFKNMTEAAKAFPSDYLLISNMFRKNVEFYRFKFTLPDYQAGTAHDCLVQIDDRWVIFPSVWKAF